MLAIGAGIALVIAAVILVGAVLYGIFGYHEDKLLDVRAAEAVDTTHIVVEEIRQLRIGRPQLVPTDRIDRHWAYTCLCTALWCYGWSIFIGVKPTMNIAGMDFVQKNLFASAIVIGASLTLIGSLLGQRVGRWTITPRVARNMTSPRIGDDIQIPYAFAMTGMFSLSCAMTVFGITSWQRNGFGSLGGWLSLAVIAMSGLMSVQLCIRIRLYQRGRGVVIAEAIEEIRHKRNAGN